VEWDLFQNQYSRAKATAGVLEQGAALTALLAPEHHHLVQTWLCLVGQPELQGLAANGVRMNPGSEHTDAAVSALPDALEPYMVEYVHSHLMQLLAGPDSPFLLTTAHLDVAVPAPGETQQRARRAAFSWPGNSPAAPSRSPNRRKGTARPGPYKSKRGSKPSGCLAVIVRLALLLVVPRCCSTLPRT
jgi:hypothetical protein